MSFFAIYSSFLLLYFLRFLYVLPAAFFYSLFLRCRLVNTILERYFFLLLLFRCAILASFLILTEYIYKKESWLFVCCCTSSLKLSDHRNVFILIWIFQPCVGSSQLVMVVVCNVLFWKKKWVLCCCCIELYFLYTHLSFVGWRGENESHCVLFLNLYRQQHYGVLLLMMKE